MHSRDAVRIFIAGRAPGDGYRQAGETGARVRMPQIPNQRDLKGIPMSPDTLIMTAEQVCQRLTISEPTLRRYAKLEGDFPRKIQLGPRRVGYLASDVERYVASRYEAARAAISG